MSAKQILVVEDERPIREMIAFGLRRAGFEVREAADARSGRAEVANKLPDLLLVDWMLPDTSGLEFTRALKRDRETRELPVIMLTARAEEGDKVAGLEGGADDYITKPFRFEELLARVRTRLRTPHSSEDTLLTAGDATLDLRTRQVHIAGHAIDLSAREFALAETFFRHPGQILTREQLLSQVWGYDFDPASNVVDVYVSYLRKKLGKHRITSARGMGYRLETRPAHRA